MTKPGLTYLALVMDRSGSMADIQEDMQGALNTFISDQKQVPGECQVMLVQFDDVVQTVFAHRPISEVGRIELQPRNMTALLDALGRTINELGDHFAGLSEAKRPEKVLVVTITDGLENASKDFSHDRIRQMVEEQQSKYNWSFTFLGANQDAVLVGSSLGYSAHTSMTYAPTQAGTQSLTRSLTGATTRFRGAPVGVGFAYTSKEEEDVAETVDPDW